MFRLYQRCDHACDDGYKSKTEEFENDCENPFNVVYTCEVTITYCRDYCEDPVQREDVDLVPAILSPLLVVTCLRILDLIPDERDVRIL